MRFNCLINTCNKSFDSIAIKGSIKTIIALIVFSFLYLNTFSQTTIVKDSSDDKTTMVIPGKEYVRSGYHNFFWGKHYRKEWGTFIRVNNFFLDTAYGGLEVIKEGGSRQTMGLRLKSKEGKEYVLRSIDKDFGNAFPEIYRGTFVSRVAKDQVSFGYPLAAITIAPMIAATDIYHTNPKVVFVPKQNTLGEYNDKFGDQLYLFEERPDEDQSDAPWFGNSKNVIGTEKLFEKIFEDNDNHVDQFAFAKARLFDMFIGDWGRHADQWRWATFEEDNKKIYKPIPRDRDQAYTIFDGFYPFIATHIAGAIHLESFSGDIDNIAFFNKPGYPLDHHFANQLKEEEWVKAAVELQEVLTDSLIDFSMHQLPPQLYAINGDKIAGHLRSRRDHLQDFAHRYYKYLARKIAIYGSDDRELFDIERINERETNIKVYKIKKDSSISEQPYYSRTIYKNETKDVHLYGFKDADIFKISGKVKDGIKIRLIGVTKSDTIINNRTSNDRKLQVFKGKNIYDTLFQHKIKMSPIIFATPSVYKVFEDDALGLFTRPGLHIGWNIAYHPTPVKRDSLEIVHNAAISYGIIRKTFYIDYVGRFPKYVGKWDMLLKGKFDNPAAENYHGIGNETSDSSADIGNYYNVFSKRFFGGIGIAREIKNTHFMDMTLFFQNIKVKNNNGNYIQQKEQSLPVFSGQNYAGIEAGYRYSNTDNDLIATKGINFNASGGYVMNTGNTDQSFFKTMSDVSFYIPLGNVISLATRLGGSTVSGEANYYHLSKLGGNVNVRGYSRERFYGKTSFYNNNEIRFITNTRNYFFNGKIGVLAFYDQGRIWQPEENSDKWHSGYGGGIVLTPFNKLALCATYGKSVEGTQILLRASMFF
ncbi:MAG: BamA/TamA family outer membrane protein [Bacteroidota bacterium]